MLPPPIVSVSHAVALTGELAQRFLSKQILSTAPQSLADQLSQARFKGLFTIPSCPLMTRPNLFKIFKKFLLGF